MAGSSQCQRSSVESRSTPGENEILRAAARRSFYQRLVGLKRCIIIAFLGLLLSSCADKPEVFSGGEPYVVTVKVDGESQSYTTEASNVREFLEEVGAEHSSSDLIDPPLYTPIVEDIELSIIRVTESVEVIERTVPFERRTVRNETMSSGDPAVIIQSGQPGIQEVTVRIVYRDSLEFSRSETQITVIEPAIDEIVMVGVGATPGSVDFDGILAMISGGKALVMRGSSAYAELLNTGDDLDYRVFTLSPTGSHLLYTRAATGTEQFNTLWVIGTERGDIPRTLAVSNVLWADWNPNRIGELELAFTTGDHSEIPPGWEANNDLWTGMLPEDRFADFEPEQIIESYPATYSWWGGSYAWSPSGRYIAYSYADEIGLIDNYATEPGEERRQLHEFIEFNTRADWVWIPPMSWSPDGGHLAFVKHSGEDPTSPDFETWIVDIESGTANRFVDHSGIWSYPSWSPEYEDPLKGNRNSSQVAFLKTTNPAESQRSSYTLWLMDRDGSNSRQIFPPLGENSRFRGGGDSIAWSPDGSAITFVYDDTLYYMALENGEARRITQDDSAVRNPTWAPYGPYATELLRFGQGAAGAVLQLTDQEDVPAREE